MKNSTEEIDPKIIAAEAVDRFLLTLYPISNKGEKPPKFKACALNPPPDPIKASVESLVESSDLPTSPKEEMNSS